MKPNKTDKNYEEEDTFLLQIRNQQSVFYSVAYQNLMSNIEGASKQNIDINKISSNYIISKDKDKVFHNLRIEIDVIKYNDIELPKWTILKEYKNIDSLSCQKAITKYRGRDYEAYFCKEMPIPEGPYKFKGLPGLVLEVYSKDGDYHFILDGIKNNNQILHPIQSILVKNRNTYMSQVKKFAENPSYKMLQREQSANNNFKYTTTVNGKEVDNTEKYKLFNKFIWDFMKTHNNPIETDDIWIR